MAAGGGLLKLLDAYIAIGGDTSDFDRVMSQSEAKAKAAGDRIESAFSPKRVLGALAGAAGALAGAGIASAISGATTLNELAGEYQVQTGANVAEAKVFSGVLNDLFKNAHQGYDEIAATLIGLKTHFDLSGAAAAALAANILDFAEITGGTGADAVERLNSLVKTGVIAEGDMAAVMDKLTVAHQTWGININETLDSLVKFAPAMNAFGMTTDQAIAWMSIFNKAGVDSQRVVMGFNTALQKVKTPEEFNALVAKIAATPDDLERAKLAVSLFGARAGGALANMLRPGTQSVADMAAVIGTDYVGAVQKAAAVNDSTFGGQALLMLHKFQGALADLGTNMGELLLVFALIGPGLTKGLLMGLGGIGGLLIPKVAAMLTADVMPWMTAGTMIGTTIGTAMQLAWVVAVPVAIWAVLNAARDEWTKQTATWGFKIPDLFTGQGALAPPVPMKPATPGTNYRQAWVDAGLEAGTALPDAVAKGIDMAGPQAMSALDHLIMKVRGQIATILNSAPVPVDKLLATFGTGLQGVWDAAHRQGHATGVESMSAMAQGIIDAENLPLNAFTTMLALMKSELTPQAEAARLAGELTSTQLAAGLADKRPAVAAQAIAAKEAILDRLVTIAGESGPLGKKAMDELAAGMKDKNPTIRAYAKAAHDAVIAELNKTPADAATAGANTATAFSASFAAGLRAMNANLPGWLATWLGIAGSAPKGYTPPGGASGGSSSPARPDNTIGGAASGMPYVAYDGPVYVHQSEAILTVPQADAWRSGQAGSGGGGQTVNINGPIQIADAHDEFSLVQQLRFLAAVQG